MIAMDTVPAESRPGRDGVDDGAFEENSCTVEQPVRALPAARGSELQSGFGTRPAL